jgi:hypothetical protein
MTGVCDTCCLGSASGLPSNRRLMCSLGEHVLARAMAATAGHKAATLWAPYRLTRALGTPGYDAGWRVPRVPSVLRGTRLCCRRTHVLVGGTRQHAPTQEWLVDIGTENPAETQRLTKEAFTTSTVQSRGVDLKALLQVQAVGLPSGSDRRSCCGPILWRVSVCVTGIVL